MPFRLFLTLLLGFALVAHANRPPNIVVIMADDLGYGDLGCYGHPVIRTPHLDRMAAEGMRFTSFYSAAHVCTPSRAALLTGRYPVRSGMASEAPVVLFPNSLSGLPASEVTLPEMLKERGYATMCVGKWHLGHLPAYLPTRHGFDHYFGIPYSNDMKPAELPLLRDETVIEKPADQTKLTARYSEEAIAFIEKNKKKPFFLYLPQTFPHVPLFASPAFKGKSARGLYGDVVEELDWGVGQILDALRRNKLDKNTLVIFTSDNGPWLLMKGNGGSAGLLRDGKGSTWEGGMRVPGIAWWPGKIKAGQVFSGMASTLDILPTAMELSGGSLPKDRPLDGFSLVSVLTQGSASPRQEFLYFFGERLFAIRQGAYKAHFFTQSGLKMADITPHETPLLYNLEQDPSEQFNLATNQPAILQQLIQRARERDQSIARAENQLIKVNPPPPAAKK